MIGRNFLWLLALFAAGAGVIAAGQPLRAEIGQPIVIWAAAGQAGEPDTPMPVITDTPEYCSHLETKIMAHSKRPPDVKQLLLEGHMLCDHGQVREGIAHLRRALLLLKRRAPTVVVP